ncbi:EAL and HDOD domain-containing protein [Chitinibacteraceae bacterium HSL-7]
MDRQQRLVAYELLFRSGAENAAHITDEMAASATVISHAVADLGLVQLLDGKRAFINVGTELLFADELELLPADRVVLEVLETVELTDEVYVRVAELKSHGYQIALDDVVALSPAHLPLLPFVDVIKVDIAAVDLRQLPELVKLFRKRPVQLLAEKVSDSQTEQLVVDLGFDLYQGYLYACPVVLSGRKLAPGETQLLRLVALLNSDAELADIEAAFKGAPELMLGLLRLVNSVASGLLEPIGSIRHAITLLGRLQLQRWLQILLYSQQLAHGRGDLLLYTAATRGRMMEQLARCLCPGRNDVADQASLCGLMSLLDRLLEQPFAELLPQLNLTAELEGALLDRDGELGEWLTFVCALEVQDCSWVQGWLARWPALDLAKLNQMQIEALTWADALHRQPAFA